MLARIKEWVNDRWPLSSFLKTALEEEVVGGASYAYSFGSAVLFVFSLQVLTGIWQLFYYVPSTDHAYNSVNYIRTQVPFGWLIHDLHYWGANAMIILLVVHISRVYIWGAYKKPRELTWLLGVGLFFLTMGMSFTGAPLPWDELGYWALEVGTSMAGTVPGVGLALKELLRGGGTMGQLTLSRMFVIHVALLPGLLLALIGAHLVAFRHRGNAGPWAEERRQRREGFWPEQAYKDIVVAALVFVVLVGLCAFFAPPFTGPADALDTTYHPKPEWNFLFLYQMLKLFPGSIEFVGTVGLPLLGGLAMVLLPFLDRGDERNPRRRPVMMALGAIAGVTIITFTILGAYSQPGMQAAKSQPGKTRHPLSASAKAGQQLFQSQGCSGCHQIDGNGGSTGPELSGDTLAKRSDGWIKTQIKNPKAHDPNTVMPAFSSLSEQQVQQLVAYLRAVGTGTSGSASGPAKDPPPKADPPAGASADPAAGSEPPAHDQVASGRQVFQSAGCSGCHKVNGSGGSVGPELSAKTIGNRSRAWLEVQIKTPKSHDPKTAMPSFGSLGEAKIKALVAYLQSIGKSEVDKGAGAKGQAASASASNSQPAAKAKAAAGGSTTSGDAGTKKKVPVPKEEALPGAAASMIGNPPHGAVIFKQKCESCHGFKGRGGIPNPGSDYGKIPALNPAAKGLFSKDPVTFARNLDRVIQNGATPAGPNPAKSMPAYGKTNTLSQQEIAEVEAYIMALNGVDRGELVHPGMQPKLFFALVAVVFVLAGLLLLLLRAWLRR